MWIEAVLSKDDIADLARKLSPLEIRLGDAGGKLRLTEPREIFLMPTVGLHIVCSGHLEWPVLGVSVPVTFHSLRMRVLPEIDKRSDGDALAFKLEIEHADIAVVPNLVDNHITDVINRELAKKGFGIAWDFTDSLTHVFELPDAFDAPRSIGLRVRAGHVRVTDEALVLAISFDASVGRESEHLIGEYAEAQA